MKKILLLIFAATLVYLPALSIFFSADDWFHLRVSNITQIKQFVNFFSFSKTPESITFYRPLSTQTFFFSFQKLFGLNPTPYHLFVILCFSFSLFLVYQLGKIIFKLDQKAILVALIYGFSVSNFTRLYFLSAFQEIALVIFSLLTIISYLKGKQLYSISFFILALLSKETAVVLPAVLFVIDWTNQKQNPKKLLQFAILLLPYLYLRLTKFGGASGESYLWNFSPTKMGNTLIWYFLWSLGAPELLIDYIGSAFRPIPRFFTDYPYWWPVILGLLLINLALLAVLFLKKPKKINRKFVSFIVLFVVSLSPVLFLPQHKFTLELGLPLVWFSLAIAWLLPPKGKLLAVFLLFFLATNLSMNYLTYTRHYSVGSAKIAHKVYDYFQKNYPVIPPNSYFEFINDTQNYGASWGSSKQISNAVGGSELFRVLYHDPRYLVFYEDYPGPRPQNATKIPLSTKAFYQ